MMHQKTTASTQFTTPNVCVFTVDGDPDTLAFYDAVNSAAWIAINDPLDTHEWR